jgi:hypothetical protein
LLAVVPDRHRPFTITMHNPKDGLDYVVAHYEPQALQHATLSGSSNSADNPAANLCAIFYSRDPSLLMQRVSAADRLAEGQDPDTLLMAMAGTRQPGKGNSVTSHLSRYHDDHGECMLASKVCQQLMASCS